ncbi:MAG: tRNA lysidine(34) synthetase TilS [Candidatus Caenarcaniphilales bacterium]|nr:tRNA lysidine(34) synthetase TilS [Candidatus Caenarcaniphilales bacterium]
MQKLIRSISEIFESLSPQKALIVACSGGSDSVALIHLLRAYLSGLDDPPELICAHFNHRWSKDSSKPAFLVEKFAAELGVKFVLGQSRSQGRTSENQAREERHAFLRETAILNRAETIWMAHHLDDQIETFFLRLLRGTGPEGILGMRPLKITAGGIKLARPFLNIPKTELKKYCQSVKLFHYEDPTNQEIDIKRNYIRHKLIPQITRLESNYQASILNLLKLIEGEHDLVENKFKLLLPDNFENCRIFSKQPIALQRLILKKILEDHELTPSFELIENLRMKVGLRASFKHNLSTNLYLVSDGMHYQMIRDSPTEQKGFKEVSFYLQPQEVSLEGVGICKIEYSRESFAKIPRQKNSETIYADFSSFVECELVWRTRMPGDQFHPLNARFCTKLKSFLINRKVRKLLFNKTIKEGEDSQELIVLAAKGSNQVLWIPGIEISDLIKVSEDGKATHRINFQRSSSYDISESIVNLSLKSPEAAS